MGLFDVFRKVPGNGRPAPDWTPEADAAHPIPPFLVAGEKPPWDHEAFRERIQRQSKHRDLFLGKHAKVWEVFFRDRMNQWDEPMKKSVELAVNFPGRLAKLWAGLMVGEFPRFYASTDEATQAVKDILERSGGQRVMYEGDLTRSYAGEIIYKVVDDGRFARFQAVSPSIWFPWVDPGNVKEAFAHVLAWKVTLPPVLKGAKPDEYVRAEIHYRGHIKHRMWHITDGVIAERVSIPNLQTDRTDYDTGVDDFLLVHVPNLSLPDQLEGIDDYSDAEPLFQELDVRLSQIARILDKHATPNMFGPKSAIEWDPITNEYRYRTDPNGRYFPVEKGDEKPGYVTWDGKLDASFKQLEKTLDALFFVSSTTPALFSVFGQASGYATSGTALKLRLIAPIAKVNEKRIYLDPAIRRVLLIAQMLEEIQGRAAGKPIAYKPELPSVDWADGLPQDEKELAERLQISTGNQPFMSVKTAVETMHPTWDKKTVAEEVERIREDGAMAGPLPIENPPPQDTEAETEPGDEEADA